MAQTIITHAFEALKAQQAANGSLVTLDTVVLALVPGLDPTQPADPNETLPPAGQIVHRQPVDRASVLHDNAVVYSLTLGTDVGDFDFNWLGLVDSVSGELAMVVHAPVQSKVATAGATQGNALTRSFMMEYDGARSATGLSAPVSTWQIDFTARLAGMDERVRVQNMDIWGDAAFPLGMGVSRRGADWAVDVGYGYVGGLRADLPAPFILSGLTLPTKVWADVTWKGTLTGAWHTALAIRTASTLSDYFAGGERHFVAPLADIAADGTVTDLRKTGTLTEQALKGSMDGFLKKSESLADLQSPALARDHLELGTAATLDTGTAKGEVLTVGALNIGSEFVVPNHIDWQTYPFAAGERLCAAGDTHFPDALKTIFTGNIAQGALNVSVLSGRWSQGGAMAMLVMNGDGSDPTLLFVLGAPGQRTFTALHLQAGVTASDLSGLESALKQWVTDQDFETAQHASATWADALFLGTEVVDTGTDVGSGIMSFKAPAGNIISQIVTHPDGKINVVRYKPLMLRAGGHLNTITG